MLKLFKRSRSQTLCCWFVLNLLLINVNAEAPVNSYLPPTHSHGHNGDGGHHEDHHADLVPPSSSYGTPDSSYGPPHHQSGFHPDHHEYEDHHDQHGTHDDSGSFENEPAKYEFSYEVDNDDADLSFGHEEMRDGDYTTGKYNVLLPDGRRQIVEYEADHKGYRPKITYEGGDEHPHHHDHPHEHGHGHEHGHNGYAKETPHTQLGYPRESHHGDLEHNGIAHGANEYDSHSHDNGHSRSDHGIHDGHRGYDNNAHEYHSNGNGHEHGHGHIAHNGQNGFQNNGHHRRRSSNSNHHHHSVAHQSSDFRYHNGFKNFNIRKNVNDN